ncbi:MAG: nitroreductase family protein [Deltaproteobacteria bacterium]|nr:MAG: nitroreductase family protein [Deltaproteobacteria bacterium]
MERMEDILDLLKARRSVRHYQRKEVSREVIERLIEAARWSPSGANIQPWHFVVVTREDLRREVGDEAKFFFVKSRHVSEAPLLIVVCGDTKSSFHVVDCSLAGANIIMEATSLGLGTCWIGAFHEDRIKEILGIPEGMKVVGIITVGYPAETPPPPPKLELLEILHWEVFRDTGRSFRSRVLRSGPLSVLPRILKMIFRMR